jgi:hypothetical protein
MIPSRFAAPLAVALSAAELACGGLLLLGWLPRLAAIAGIALFAMFTLTLASALRRHSLPGDCGCFKPGHKASELSVYRNVALIGMLLLRLGEDRWSQPLTAAALIVLLAGLVLSHHAEAGGQREAVEGRGRPTAL